jgi:hypothetical protein
MEPGYEKVCPSCGRSAILAAKFCSGCGHQYRTVFHDNGPSDNVSSPSDIGGETSFDLRFAPVVAILPVLAVVVWFLGNRPAAPPQDAPPTAVVQTAATTTTPVGGLPYFGEQPVEVQAALGRPMAGSTSTDWYYPYNGKTLQVHFNDRDVVEGLTQY